MFLALYVLPKMLESLAFSVLQKVIFVMKLTKLRSLIRTEFSFDGS